MSSNATPEPPRLQLSAVVPFYNESGNVLRVLDELRTVLEALSMTYEVLAVDDGSADDTAAKLHQLAATWPQLRVLCHAHNQGQAAALWTAFQQAGGELVATLDGDGQNDPAALPAMIAHLNATQADMVAGVRAERQDSWLRKKMSRIANNLRQVFLKDGVSDSGCALKVLRREVCGAFIPLRTLYSFMPALAVSAGFKVVEMAVPHRARTAGVSNYGLVAMLWRPALDMIGVWWFGLRRFPLGNSPRSAPTGDSRSWRGLWLLLAALFVFLGTRGLNEPDEGRYSELGREMAAGGSWLVPHLNGFEHFQKPPLIYWCTAASFKVLGCHEWAARMPSALAAAGILLLTMAIARRLWTETRARVAAMVLVATFLFFGLARMLTPDMLMSFFITAAIAALVYERCWLFFIMMGLGFLTKGPMALVVPLSAALGAHLARDRNLPRVRFPWGRGMLVTLLVGLSWFILLAVLDPPLFEYFWRYELLDRFASTKHGRSHPFWFFGPVLIAGLLPWTFLIPGLIREAWRRLRARQISPAQGLLLGWTVLPLIVLSLSGSKLVTYVLPLVPAFALAFSTRFADVRRVRVIAVPAIAVLLILAGLMSWSDPWMGQQASVRSLVRTIRKQPDADAAVFFSSGVRAHGFEFYLRQLVSVTEHQADIVLPLSKEQQARVVKPGEDCAKLFSTRPAYGLVRIESFEKDFAPVGWTKLDQAGDFVLVGNAALIGAAQNPRR